MDFRHRLLDLVSASGLTQAELAARLGENRYWVHNRLHGDTDIKVDDIPRLAAALSISPAAFFDDSPLAEVVLAAILRALAEIPPRYRRELFALADRLQPPQPLDPLQERLESTRLARSATGYMMDAWNQLPEEDREAILEIIEDRRTGGEEETH